MIADPRQDNIAKGYWGDLLSLLALCVSRPEGALLLAIVLFGNLGRMASRGYEFYAAFFAVLLFCCIYALSHIADRKKFGRKWTIFLFAVLLGILGFFLGYEFI